MFHRHSVDKDIQGGIFPSQDEKALPSCLLSGLSLLVLSQVLLLGAGHLVISFKTLRPEAGLSPVELGILVEEQDV